MNSLKSQKGYNLKDKRLLVTVRSVVTTFFMLCMSLLLAAYANTSEDYINKGINHLEDMNYRGALIDFNSEIMLNPDNASAFNYRGVTKAKLGDFDGAIMDYNTSINLEPNSIEALNNRGIAKARTGDLDGSISDFDIAISIDPLNGNSYFNHGMAMDMISNITSACSDWEKSYNLGFKEANRFVKQKCS